MEVPKISIAVGIDTDGPGWGSMARFLGGLRTHSGTSASCPQLNWRVTTRNSNLPTHPTLGDLASGY